MEPEKNKILIIDDDSRNTFALSAVLNAYGLKCISVNQAKDGINLLRKDQSIGIVLMDMMMPDLDGYQAIAAIRKDKNTQNIYIIAVTAQAMRGDREKCLDAGADDYVAKPVDVDRLLSIINQTYRGRTCNKG